MSLIAGASIYSNFVGDYFDDEEGASVIQRVVIANQDSFDPTSNNLVVQQDHMDDKKLYRLLVIYSDLAYTALFLLFLLITGCMT